MRAPVLIIPQLYAADASHNICSELNQALNEVCKVVVITQRFNDNKTSRV
jgi:hypothetical protein